MYDNGLLKYYEKHSCNGGYLDARVLGLKEENSISCKVSECSSAAGRFFRRVNGGGRVIEKFVTDSQVLLSQIYNKAGIQSAIYLPAEVKGKKFLLSNSVLTPETVLADDYIEGFPKFEYRFPIDFLNPRHTGAVVEKYFTERAMLAQTKMRVYDTASFNNDRHYANFFYKLKDGKADDVVAIDFEIGSCAFYPEDKLSDVFFNDFENHPMIREEMLEHFRTNEEFAILMDKDELAEEIGSISPTKVAQDIKQTIGYEINPDVTDLLERSFDQVAEALAQ